MIDCMIATAMKKQTFYRAIPAFLGKKIMANSLLAHYLANKGITELIWKLKP